jgi:hypothetical protein
MMLAAEKPNIVAWVGFSAAAAATAGAIPGSKSVRDAPVWGRGVKVPQFAQNCPSGGSGWPHFAQVTSAIGVNVEHRASPPPP